MKPRHPFVFPPKKILVPLDLSEASEIAWRQAKALGASFGAQVEGLFVQEWLAYGQIPPVPSGLKELLAGLRRRLGAGDEIGATRGEVGSTIISWGRELDYDLIVMGSHARNGLNRLIMGSIAETVVRASEIPVLVVRKETPRWRSVLAPVNFTPYSMTGLKHAADVALILGAQLNVLHVLDGGFLDGMSGIKGPKHLLRHAVDNLPADVREVCKPKASFAFGYAAEEIAKAAEDHDLVVMVAHRRGFVSDMVLGTTTERLLRYGTASVLALPSETAVPRGKKALEAPFRMR